MLRYLGEDNSRVDHAVAGILVDQDLRVPVDVVVDLNNAWVCYRRRRAAVGAATVVGCGEERFLV